MLFSNVGINLFLMIIYFMTINIKIPHRKDFKDKRTSSNAYVVFLNEESAQDSLKLLVVITG